MIPSFFSRIIGPAFGFGMLFLCPVALGQLKADVGFDSLQARLGAAMPTGAGVSATQVEAPSGGYAPDVAAFPDKNFTFSSGVSGVSGHATAVASFFYGPSSLSPDLGAAPQGVNLYEAGGFLTTDLLRTAEPAFLPGIESNDVQNHSWIGNFTDVANDINALRRIDYAIQRDDFVATFGLNNGSGTGVPNLMGSAYNGITVGLSNGNHSRGGASLDGGFRTKPDIVVPTDATSWAAPTVGSAASLLIETARTTPSLANADRSVVIKSLLMTGATRDEPEFGGNWSNSASSPLDPIYGAGELNIDRSHEILENGEFNASTVGVADSTGWDLGQSSATMPQLYFFDLDPGNVVYQIAATLVWNRDITATLVGLDYEFTAFLADLNLRLFNASGFVLGSEILNSSGTGNNVELITASGLAPGRYAWQVSSDTDGVDYGFSWLLEGASPAPAPIPEPSVAVMLSLFCLAFFKRVR